MQEEKEKKLSCREIANLAAEIAERIEKESGDYNQRRQIIQAAASLLFGYAARLTVE